MEKLESLALHSAVRVEERSSFGAWTANVVKRGKSGNVIFVSLVFDG
jgi:hypothetical protein